MRLITQSYFLEHLLHFVLFEQLWYWNFILIYSFCFSVLCLVMVFSGGKTSEFDIWLFFGFCWMATSLWFLAQNFITSGKVASSYEPIVTVLIIFGFSVYIINRSLAAVFIFFLMIVVYVFAHQSLR